MKIYHLLVLLPGFVQAFVVPKQGHVRLAHQIQHTSSLPSQKLFLYKPKRLDTRNSNASELQLLPSITELGESLFSYTGNVPYWQAFGLNAILFALLSKKLLKSLTPEGFAHSFALGTLLWTTLGWRGWSLCVLYLVAGNLVTKVRFAEKEKRGLAEKRGGRRGPENVW
jgi:hypothetical protein